MIGLSGLSTGRPHISLQHSRNVRRQRLLKCRNREACAGRVDRRHAASVLTARNGSSVLLDTPSIPWKWWQCSFAHTIMTFDVHTRDVIRMITVILERSLLWWTLTYGIHDAFLIPHFDKLLGNASTSCWWKMIRSNECNEKTAVSTCAEFAVCKQASVIINTLNYKKWSFSYSKTFLTRAKLIRCPVSGVSTTVLYISHAVKVLSCS